MDKMVLKNAAEIAIERGSQLGDILVLSKDKVAMVAVWEQLTPDNLTAVQIKNADGVITGEYADLVLEAETSRVQSDGSVLTRFVIREKTDMERLQARLAAVEEGQAIQDGAIEDIAAVTSTLAEGGVQ